MYEHAETVVAINDCRLKEAVKKYGNKWVKVAGYVGHNVKSMR
jgi:hypothetical protein